MRHIFIINPAAGKRNCTAEIMAMAKRLTARGLKTECILTKSPGHARETAAAAAAAGGPVRFYACGGDGTVNEVANGIAGQDAENLFDGPQFPLDAIDCNGRLALTVACAGLDAQVAEDVHRYGGLLKGQGSYIVSLAVNFFSKSYSRRWTVALDGERVSGEFILAAVCNGRYYGGGFMPSAEARMDDGMLHTVLVRRVDRLTFLRLVGDYAKGCAYRYPEVVRRSTAREVVIESGDGEIVICLDGETVHSRRVALRLSEKRVNFFGPEGCDPNATCRASEA